MPMPMLMPMLMLMPMSMPMGGWCEVEVMIELYLK
jgi:hypothetical protein